MYQGIGYDLRETLRTVEQAGLFEHGTCTVLARSNDGGDPAVNTMGQPDLATMTAIDGLSNIPCMLSPRRQSDPDQRGVDRKESNFDQRTERRLLLDGYYPQVKQRHVVDVTMADSGVTERYQIMSVEPPSQETFTSLAVRILTY